MVMEDDLILSGGHTMQYTDDGSQMCALVTYMNTLNNITLINFF